MTEVISVGGDYADRDIQVDYDFNPTQLYLWISDSDWYETLKSLKENPIQGRIWVVKTENRYQRNESTCRFLPIHSACAREPPLSVLAALLESYPEGAKRQDDNGMYPIHYACANHASAEVIQLLLNYYPDGRYQRIEASGALPIHLAAQWGVSSIMVMKHLLRENNSLASARDSEGLSPLEVAIDAEYREGKVAIINVLRDAILQDTIEYSSTISSSPSRISSYDSDEDDEVGEAKNKTETITGRSGEYMQTAEELKVEILNLQNKTAYIKASVNDQLKLEWKAVKIALREMEDKMGDLEGKTIRSRSNGLEIRDDSLSGVENSASEHRDDKSSALVTVKADNRRMEDELERLEHIHNTHTFKVASVEQIIKGLADTITKIAIGHNSTIARLKKMEHDMIKTSQLQAAKLNDLSREVDAIKISSPCIEHAEKRAFDVLKKEQEILEKMGDIIRVLKS